MLQMFDLFRRYNLPPLKAAFFIGLNADPEDIDNKFYRNNTLLRDYTAPISEDGTLHSYCFENPKSNNTTTLLIDFSRLWNSATVF
jgi:hypothetical protein